jgi:hypothetical protein
MAISFQLRPRELRQARRLAKERNEPKKDIDESRVNVVRIRVDCPLNQIGYVGPFEISVLDKIPELAVAMSRFG